jgi:hypothetical protein
LLFFAAATGQSARVVNSAVKTNNDFVKVWTTVDTNGLIRVAVLHKQLNATADASVDLDFSASLTDYPDAVLIRLKAPNPRATSDHRQRTPIAICRIVASEC